MGTIIKSKAVYTGWNYDVGPWNDTHFIRCSRCGWINNTDREIHSNDGSYEGWGTTFTVVTSTSAGSGYGPNSPINTMQTNGPIGQIMYNTSMNYSDILVNAYGTFSFGLAGSILLNSNATGNVGVMLLLFNSNIYYIDNSSHWWEYNGVSFVSINQDPRLSIGNLVDYNESNISYDSGGPYDSPQPYTDQTMDAVVGAGCSQCGTMLYTR